MSFTMHGTGVSGGIAIGYAHLVSNMPLEVLHYNVPPARIDEEVRRFDAAVHSVRAELEALGAQVPEHAPAEVAAFLTMHVLLLNDPTLSEAPRQMIMEQLCNAEWAVKQQIEHLSAQFDEIDDPYLRERKADVVQVGERVLKELLGHPTQIPVATEANSVLVARDLSPADVIQFKSHRFAAFVTDVGGTTSHTAILARSLGIPCIVALHQAREMVCENELLIVDGTQGVLMVNPDRAVLEEYRLRQNEYGLERQKLKRIKTTRPATLDGTEVELHANIELPSDIDQVKVAGATGIGLFRTEFLFLSRDSLPDEDEQFEAYRAVARAMKGKKVTIRTLDLGADKGLEEQARTAVNPALGLRAIRYCLSEPRLFLTQLRAILRASHYGQVQLLLPMISNLAEIRQTLALVEEAKASLRGAGVPFDEGIRVGGMIEVPAAAIAAPIFAQHLDFLSIGTNDLISYTLAIDRADEAVSHLYDPLHPAILQLLVHTLRAAEKAGKPVSLCGEMAGDAALTRLLLGLGLRSFSMHPAHILTVKQQILKADLPSLAPQAAKIVKQDDSQKIRSLLAKLNG